MNKKNKIALVNLSLGAGVGLDPVKENRITEAVEELCNCGITVVVSAGNYGLQSRKVSVPGTNEKVLTVGAYRRSGMGQVLQRNRTGKNLRAETGYFCAGRGNCILRI